ncbi:MAG: hypothetical protein E7408_07690, partial [Ruminococcaceae bacterium]|nr:hypothetical protein [Oscillospiraceae bacterium]
MKLKNKLWLWGQTEGSHHINNAFGLPGMSRMTPLEGAYYFGIPNMCRVVMAGLPKPPFDQDAMVLDTMDNVVWSIIGDGGSGMVDFTDEIVRLSQIYPNITGAIMDDFMSQARMKKFTPEVLRGFKKKLREEAARPLPLWTVIYVSELTEERRPYIAECDLLQMWTWRAEDLLHLEENLTKLKDLSSGQKIMAGCYMWDYGNHKEMPAELMQLQLDTYYKWLKEGKIEGVIFCSNCCADLKLAASD